MKNEKEQTRGNKCLFKKEKKGQNEMHKSFFSLCEKVVTRLSGPLIEKIPHLFLLFFVPCSA